MNQKKLLFSFAGILLVAGFIFGFSGNDEGPTSLSPVNPSMEINFINGTNIDMVGAWTSGAPFPIPLADLGGGQGYTRNDTGFVFVIGGEVGLTDVRRYNTVTNTWSTVAPLPSGRDRGTTARVRDSLYMIGGANSSNTYTNTLYRYDINGNSWTTKANIPQNIGWGKAVGYQDSLIYLIGGYNGTATLSTVYLYNTISNTWRTADPIPGIRFAGACAISGDTIVYISGVDGAAIQNTTYRGVIDQSDRTQITWTTGAPLPAPVSSGMFRIDAHSWGNKGIILTGGSADIPFTNVSNVCFTYSPGANVWTAQPNKPTAWTAGQSGAVNFSNGIWKLVCASGYGGASQINNTEIFTDTLSAPPGGNSTLVLLHDSTLGTAGNIAERKQDRDTLLAALDNLISDYDVMTFDTTTSLPDLSGYNTIIVQELSFDDPIVRYLGATARGQIMTWIGTGTPGNKKALLMIGADLGYNYSRALSPAQDLAFSQNMLKFVYQADNSGSLAPPTITGTGIDAGNQRAYSTTTSGFWPDGCSIETGGTSLYHYTGRGTDDSLTAIGYNGTGYVSASMNMDPRYFTGDFQITLQNLIGYLVANGGTITGVQPVSSIIPDRFELKQNYPNPFNPSTKIEYSIPKNGLVTLKIYNMLGQEIRTLISEFHNSGTYSVEFNASEFASGTYFYSLQTEGFIETKKMVLLK